MSTPAAFSAAITAVITWLGFAWLTGYGLGPMALVPAIGVSLLLRVAADGRGVLSGAVGAVLVLCVMLLGRLWIVGRFESAANEHAATAAVTDHAMLLGLAQQIAQTRLDAGDPLELPGGRPLPAGAAAIEFASREDVPDAIWRQAEQLWQSADRQRRVEQAERRRQFIVKAREADSPRSLAARFGLGGLFWATMAAATAFLIGSRTAA